MGRRAKTGYQSKSNAFIRNHTLWKLISLNSAIMDETLTGDKMPLYKELLRRAEADEENMISDDERAKVAGAQPINRDSYARHSDLIINYLNADDVMQVLGCSRRSAMDYLVALRRIHVYHSFLGRSLMLAGRV